MTLLVEARKSYGLTQRELAARLGKPPSFVAKIEVGERRVDVVEFIAISRAIGVPDDGLLADLAATLPGDLSI
ncbi:helix-turn-helix domain-containing protein [Caulobacter sp. Root1472]|uniref:helix-turn-helix domain-containing protein n=1 Tax=Caulobacter sp. Root1472 TaxID=1736470 RepID=UPI001F2D5018|nr:helix-turn-helix transcriptional regulator [Caulobacter sp. Root1472]